MTEKTNIEQFAEITQELLTTYKAKNHDYGNSFEKGCDKYGIVSAVSRLDEKMERLNTLYNQPENAKVNESLEDTVGDIANYSIMLLMYLRTHRK